MLYFTYYYIFLYIFHIFRSGGLTRLSQIWGSRSPHFRPCNKLAGHWFHAREPSRLQQRSLSPVRLLLKPFSQSERRQRVGASRRIRLALKCFHGRRSRVGFNGRLRGFRWIISGGTGKKGEASPPPPSLPSSSSATLWRRLSVRKATTKRVGYTITRWDMRGTPTIRPPIGLRASRGSPLASGRDLIPWIPDMRDWPHGSVGTPKEILSKAFLSNGPPSSRPPAVSAGRCGHVTPCVENRVE